MASIMKFLENEKKKGNVLIDRYGNTISREKVETLMKKAYISGIKSGEINIETPYIEYASDEIAKGYMSIDTFLHENYSSEILTRPVLPELPEAETEPEEPANVTSI